MTARLDELERLFANADVETRRMLLLDFAERLPPLPDEYRLAIEHGVGRVHECQTPVFIFASLLESGSVRLHGFAPEESPTVRGVVSLLLDALDGAAPGAVAAVPDDLFRRMGLAEAIGMMRQRGLTAVLIQVKQEVSRLAGSSRHTSAGASA